MFADAGDALFVPFHDTIGIFFPVIFFFGPPNQVRSIFQHDSSASQIFDFRGIWTIKFNIVESKNENIYEQLRNFIDSKLILYKTLVQL